MYKPSKYNLLFYHEGHLIVFNTYYKTIASFEKKNEQALKVILLKFDRKYIDMNSDLIEFCYNKNFMINQDVNEIDLLSEECKKLVNSKILQLTIMPTYCCNLSCIYCFQKHKPDSFMSDEIIKDIVTFVENNIDHYNGLYVEWFGGEPLITKKKVLQMHKAFRKIAVSHKRPYVARITTNGYELDLDTFQELYKNNCFIYYISIDGSKEIHDRQRPGKGGQGTYDRIIDNLKNISNTIKARNFRIEIRVNNSTETLKYIEDFYLEYKRYFGDDKRFSLVLDAVQDWSDRTENMYDSLLQDSDVAPLGELASKYNIQLNNMSLNTLTTQICQAAKRYAYSIFFDGTIHKCQMAMERDEYKGISHIGKISDKGLIINKEKESLWVSDSFPQQCYECIALPLCLGKKCVYAINIKEEKCENIQDKLVSSLKVQEFCKINKIECYKEKVL